jgi:hypothetical protein
MGRVIQIRGYRFDRHGRLVPDQRWLSVSTKIRQRKSKRVRATRRKTPCATTTCLFR